MNCILCTCILVMHTDRYMCACALICCLKVALSECCIKVNEANYCVRYIPVFFIYPKGVVACNGKKFNYSRIMKTLMLSSDSKYN